MGKNERLANVMVYDSWITVWKLSIFGYMSKGEMVPEVIITDRKRSKTGLMAIDASKHVKCKMGLGTVSPSVSNGSKIS